MRISKVPETSSHGLRTAVKDFLLRWVLRAAAATVFSSFWDGRAGTGGVENGQPPPQPPAPRGWSVILTAVLRRQGVVTVFFLQMRKLSSRAGSGLMIYGTQCEMKIQCPCSKRIKNFKMATAGRSPQLGGPSEHGPA